MSDKKETIGVDFGCATECSVVNVIGLGFDKGVDFNKSHKSTVSHSLFIGGKHQALVDIDTSINEFLSFLKSSNIPSDEKVELKIRAEDVRDVIIDPSINTSFSDKLDKCYTPLKKLLESMKKVKDIREDLNQYVGTITYFLSLF